MKNHLCLAILFVIWQTGQSEKDPNVDKNIGDGNQAVANLGYFNKIIEGFGKNIRPEKSGKIDDDNDDRGVFERNGYFHDIDAGNPDIHGRIKRPCQVYDTFCIRKFFAEHSSCKISGREVPDPLIQAQGTVNFARINISETHINAVYRGLNNARISEFYINEATDNLVIAITLNNASKTINNGYFQYHLRGREPVVTRGFITIQYGVLTVTVIIPNINNLKLERSEIYTYGDTNIYPFVLGPTLAESTDPEVLAMFASFYINPPLDYQEEISNQGNFMIGNYIQYNICDFGLKNL